MGHVLIDVIILTCMMQDFEYKDNFFINGSNEFYSKFQCFSAVRVNNFTIDKSRMRLYFTDYL